MSVRGLLALARQICLLAISTLLRKALDVVPHPLTPVAMPCCYVNLCVCLCCRYISRYFSSVQGFSTWQLLPSRRTLAGCVLAAACTAASSSVFMTQQQLELSGFWHQAALHVAVGVLCLAALGACIVSGERQTMRQLLQLRRQRGGGEEGGSAKED